MEDLLHGYYFYNNLIYKSSLNLVNKLLLECFLSRLTRIANKDLVDDEFLDEHLFSISLQTPWYADLENTSPLENSINILATKNTTKS